MHQVVKERYWDQVILDYHMSEYDVSVRVCNALDIVEIDTFAELKALIKLMMFNL